MQRSNFEDNLRFFKDILPYNVFYGLLRNKNYFKKIDFERSASNFEIILEENNKIKLNFEVEKLGNYKIIVYTSLLSFFIFKYQYKNEPDLSIIFLDESTNLGNIFLSFNISQFINNKEKYFFVIANEDIDFIINFLAKNLNYLKNPALIFKIDEYDKNFNKNSQPLIDLFSLKFNELIIDYSTHSVMLPKQIINTLENLNFINKTLNIEPNEQITSLVISAGPSLNKDIEKIKKISDRVIIIAVDTALRFLLKNDIIPDIIIALDPQALNFLDFLGIKDLKDSFLLIEISSSYKIVQKYFKYENLLFFAGLVIADEKNKRMSFVNNLSCYLSNALSLFNLPVYGNVGLAAISLASKISDKIILSGFDSSYNSLVYHCNETLDIIHYLCRQNYVKTALSCLNKDTLSISSYVKKRTSTLLERNSNIFIKFFPQNCFFNINEIVLENYFEDKTKFTKKELKKIIKIQNIVVDRNKFKDDILRSINNSFSFFEESYLKNQNRLEKAIRRIFDIDKK